jgi:AraC family transcriptional regulator, regulatory protein of adaptative response / methylated-DNA-[protein]-cysteine methyltransferase
MSMTESSIRFTFGESSLGQVLVAAGDKGISAILFGKDRFSLRDELMDYLPDARLASKPSDLGEVVEKVIGLIEAPKTRPDLRLDLQGSEFERRVWALLLEIPAGETTSYGAIAKKLGGAATAQEVAAACAANRHAVAIPCHRVLKADGSISGYRWGVARKRALLAREALR